MPLLEVNVAEDLDGLSDLGFNIGRTIRRAVAPPPVVKKAISMTTGAPGKLIISKAPPPPAAVLLDASGDTQKFVMGGRAAPTSRTVAIAKQSTPMVAPVFKRAGAAGKFATVLPSYEQMLERAYHIMPSDAPEGSAELFAKQWLYYVKSGMKDGEATKKAMADVKQRGEKIILAQRQESAESYDTPEPPTEVTDIQAAEESSEPALNTDEGMEGFGDEIITGVPNWALYVGGAAAVYWFFLRK